MPRSAGCCEELPLPWLKRILRSGLNSACSPQLKESLMRDRLMAALAGTFGLLAGFLAVLGLYGVIAYMVARRRNEIGVRIALGADRARVIQLVLRSGAVARDRTRYWNRARVVGGKDSRVDVLRPEAIRSGHARRSDYTARCCRITCQLRSALRAARLEPMTLREE